MGMIKEENKDFDGALADYHESLNIFEDLHSPNRDIVKNNIAILREKMGEDVFRKALEKLGGSQ